MNEYQGEWQTKGGIRVPVPAKPGPKPKPFPDHWNRRAVLKAHANYVAGSRTPSVLEGERIYQRGRKRVQRSRMSKTDREWCERTAVAQSWKPVYYR